MATTRATRRSAQTTPPSPTPRPQHVTTVRIKKETTPPSSRSTPKRVGGRKRKREDSLEVLESPLKPPKLVKNETKDCDICAETKTVPQNFPEISTCDHDATVCLECYQKQFETKIKENKAEGWEACTCPLCNESVPRNEAEALFTRDKVRKLNATIKQVCSRRMLFYEKAKWINRHKDKLPQTLSGVRTLNVATDSFTIPARRSTATAGNAEPRFALSTEYVGMLVCRVLSTTKHKIWIRLYKRTYSRSSERPSRVPTARFESRRRGVATTWSVVDVAKTGCVGTKDLL